MNVPKPRKTPCEANHPKPRRCGNCSPTSHEGGGIPTMKPLGFERNFDRGGDNFLQLVKFIRLHSAAITRERARERERAV